VNLMSSINTGDTAFVIISAALVCLMTPGLAFFYGGLVRRKNVLTIMMQNFISMGIVTTIWILGGFSLAFGDSIHGIIGNFSQYFALNGVGFDPNPIYGSTIPFLSFFSYQEMFAIITPALITGAFADRVSFKSFLVFIVIWSIAVYIPFVHWIWGGGFLAQMGVVDFAGGIVVHISAGMAALASVIYIGKRNVKPGESLEPHNVVYVALGTGLLWFGWFGFNAGSALAANGIAAQSFVNTDISGSIAMITWLFISWLRDGKPSMIGAMTGAIAGLAAITPCAGYIPSWAAFIVGIMAGFICYYAVQLRLKLGWDDALDVWGVHGVGGALGSLLVGVFAFKSVNGVSGLLEGNPHQFLVQLLAVVVTAIYAYYATYGILKLVNKIVPIRVSEEAEEEGLDKVIHGEKAYR
jgi:Amt family ammonium transporter